MIHAFIILLSKTYISFDIYMEFEPVPKGLQICDNCLEKCSPKEIGDIETETMYAIIKYMDRNKFL